MQFLIADALYAGTVHTFLIGNDLDYGAIYKITPVTTKTEIQAIKCFQLNGTKDDPIRPQAALPDLQNFEVCTTQGYSSPKIEQFGPVNIHNFLTKVWSANVFPLYTRVLANL